MASVQRAAIELCCYGNSTNSRGAFDLIFIVNYKQTDTNL